MLRHMYLFHLWDHPFWLGAPKNIQRSHNYQKPGWILNLTSWGVRWTLSGPLEINGHFHSAISCSRRITCDQKSAPANQNDIDLQIWQGWGEWWWWWWWRSQQWCLGLARSTLLWRSLLVNTSQPRPLKQGASHLFIVPCHNHWKCHNLNISIVIRRGQ